MALSSKTKKYLIIGGVVTVALALLATCAKAATTCESPDKVIADIKLQAPKASVLPVTKADGVEFVKSILVKLDASNDHGEDLYLLFSQDGHVNGYLVGFSNSCVTGSGPIPEALRQAIVHAVQPGA